MPEYIIQQGNQINFELNKYEVVSGNVVNFQLEDIEVIDRPTVPIKFSIEQRFTRKKVLFGGGVKYIYLMNDDYEIYGIPFSAGGALLKGAGIKFLQEQKKSKIKGVKFVINLENRLGAGQKIRTEVSRCNYLSGVKLEKNQIRFSVVGDKRKIKKEITKVLGKKGIAEILIALEVL